MGTDRHEKRHRERGGRYAGLPHRLLNSPAYAALSLTARAMLIEVVMQFNGVNNGALAVPRRSLLARGFGSSATITRALTELEHAGFIATIQHGGIAAVSGHKAASLFRLTWQPMSANPKLGKPAMAPSWDFENTAHEVPVIDAAKVQNLNLMDRAPKVQNLNRQGSKFKPARFKIQTSGVSVGSKIEPQISPIPPAENRQHWATALQPHHSEKARQRFKF